MAHGHPILLNYIWTLVASSTCLPLPLSLFLIMSVSEAFISLSISFILLLVAVRTNLQVSRIRSTISTISPPRLLLICQHTGKHGNLWRDAVGAMVE